MLFGCYAGVRSQRVSVYHEMVCILLYVRSFFVYWLRPRVLACANAADSLIFFCARASCLMRKMFNNAVFLPPPLHPHEQVRLEAIDAQIREVALQLESAVKVCHPTSPKSAFVSIG